MDTIQKLEFKRQIETLAAKSGHGTTLVSYYVPGNKQVADALGRIVSEQSEAANIKSKQTGDNVRDALTGIATMLKVSKKIPPNGLALFCGWATDGFVREQVEPPFPINSYLYRCGPTFITDPLMVMTSGEKTYGLIVIDQKEATIGLLVGGLTIRPLYHAESTVPRKTHMGGASQHRYQENHEIAVQEWFKRVAERANQSFLSSDISGILVGGPGFTKKTFVDSGHLRHDVAPKVLGLVDIEFTNEYGLQELVTRGRGLIEEAAATKERETIHLFLAAVGASNGGVTYGRSKCIDALSEGRVATLLLADSLPLETIKEMEAQCARWKSEMKVVSEETQEGKQFSMAFGGWGAWLRY